MARIATACPSAVAPGPVHCAAQFGLALGGATASAAAAGSGDDGDGAAGAVDEHHGAGADRVEAVDGHHAGQAELAGDDRGVAGRAAQRGGQRDDQRRVEARGVGGREVLGQQYRRHVRQRDARFGQPIELGDDPVADIAQIGDAFGHQAAELGEEVDELVDGRDHGARRGGACVDELLGGAQPGAVLRQRGRRGQHLRRGAGRVGGAVAQPGRPRRCAPR